jgi:hypothetical protein
MNSTRCFHLISALFLLSCGCWNGGSPQLAVGQVLDLGVLPQEGKDLEIPISNHGTGKLQIYEVATSCRCAVVEAPKMIAPCETKNLVLKPPVGRPGPNAARLVIRSNDPAGPHEVYMTWFDESARPQLDPPRIVLHRGVPGRSFEHLVTITYPGGATNYPLTVKTVSTSNPLFQVSQLKSDLTAKQSDIQAANLTAVIGETTFRFGCRLPDSPGVVRGDCTFTVTQAGKEYVLTLPVDLQVVGPVSFVPDSVLFSATTSGQLVGKKKRVLLTTTGPAELSVVGAPEILRYNLVKQSAGSEMQRYLLELEVAKEPRGRKLECTVVVQLANKQKTRAAIPVEIVTLD